MIQRSIFMLIQLAVKNITLFYLNLAEVSACVSKRVHWNQFHRRRHIFFGHNQSKLRREIVERKKNKKKTNDEIAKSPKIASNKYQVD